VRGRIRSIKPDVLKDEDLWDLEAQTGLPIYRAFTGLWMFADREGRFEWRPRVLKTDILPYWDGDFSRVLDALTTRGFVVKYACGTREFGWVPNLKKHQIFNNREADSDLPDPEGPESKIVSITIESTRDPRVDDACPTPLSPALVDWEGIGKGLGMGMGGDASADAHSRPLAANSDPDSAKATRSRSEASKIKTELRAVLARLAPSYGLLAPPTASLKHWSDGAAKIQGLMASGASMEAASERVVRAALDRLTAGRSSSFGYALQDCVITDRQMAESRGGRRPPSPATTGKDFEDAEDIETQVARWAND
jgi:hypothetical protein